jgi:hypothetical protein
MILKLLIGLAAIIVILLIDMGNAAAAPAVQLSTTATP